MRIFRFIKKHLVFVMVTAAAFLFVVLFSMWTRPVRAVGVVPIGGLVTVMTPCTCAYTSWMAASYLVIPNGRPIPGTYTYSATLTQKFLNYIPKPKSWLLGMYVPGVQACWMQAGYVCVPYPNLGLISMMGTSKL